MAANGSSPANFQHMQLQGTAPMLKPQQSKLGQVELQGLP